MRSQFISAVVTTAMVTVLFSSCRKDQGADIPGTASMEEILLSSNEHIHQIPDSLKAPEGHRLVGEGYATGVQIYEVRRSATNPNAYSWVNIAPVATLYTKPDFKTEMALHYVGPTWQITKGHNKGETVVARRVRGVTKDVSAIPWLLLQAVDSLSTANNKITYIQRLFTVGGLAPTTPADEAHLGQLDSIPYTALYLFYEAKH